VLERHIVSLRGPRSSLQLAPCNSLAGPAVSIVGALRDGPTHPARICMLTDVNLENLILHGEQACTPRRIVHLSGASVSVLCNT